MIGFIKGQIIEVDDSTVLVEVNGIGYEIQMPKTSLSTLSPNNDTVTIFTHLIIKDDHISLYGFMDKEGLELFKVLLEVSGVGPRVALNILSVLSPSSLLEDISRGDPVRLRSVHGVGKKTAARICVDLKEKAVKLLNKKNASVETGKRKSAQDSYWPSEEIVDDAVSALLNLGYKPAESKRVVKQVLASQGNIGLNDLIKASLNLLSKVR